MKLTLQALLNEGKERLMLSGIGEAELDAKYLLFKAFHTDMVHFLLYREDEVEDGDMLESAAADYREKIEKRSERIPLAQIIGSQEFMGLEFCVNSHVLIPRQDTETLAELVLKDFKRKDPEILDLCTGSGCIGISLAVLGGFSDVTLADISGKALQVAAENAKELLKKKWSPARVSSKSLKVLPWSLEISAEMPADAGKEGKNQRITLVESDMFSSLSNQFQYDVIVSNPPYIPTDVIRELEPEVQSHEPWLALDGMADGLHFYRQLANGCGAYLKPGGTVYFEIGCDQGLPVCRLLREAGFKSVTIYKDLRGLDRVVKGAWFPDDEIL